MGKVSRNNPCPCRSGLKYKRCCINKLQVENVKFSDAASDKISSRGMIDKCDECGKVQEIVEVQCSYIGDKTFGEKKMCIDCAEFLF